VLLGKNEKAAAAVPREGGTTAAFLLPKTIDSQSALTPTLCSDPDLACQNKIAKNRALTPV
jgi:hypothetical protein